MSGEGDKKQLLHLVFGGELKSLKGVEFRDLDGMEVPEVLLNGDHAKIKAWRRRESLAATLRFRPDLLASAPLSEADLKTVAEIEKELNDPCSSEN